MRVHPPCLLTSSASPFAILNRCCTSKLPPPAPPTNTALPLSLLLLCVPNSTDSLRSGFRRWSAGHSSVPRGRAPTACMEQGLGGDGGGRPAKRTLGRCLPLHRRPSGTLAPAAAPVFETGVCRPRPGHRTFEPAAGADGERRAAVDRHAERHALVVLYLLLRHVERDVPPDLHAAPGQAREQRGQGEGGGGGAR